MSNTSNSAAIAQTCVLDEEKIIWRIPFCYRPNCNKSGDWDGKRSDQILVELIDGNYVVATCYEGFMDGSYFFDWYHGVEEFELKEEDVRRWMKIPS